MSTRNFWELEKLSSTYSEKLLGIKIDNRGTVQKSQSKSQYSGKNFILRFKQRKHIFNSFTTSHFSYCPFVWMFYSRRLNKRIDHIHERTLRIIYQDYNSSFKELLRKDSSLTIHQRNLKLLVTEMFKNWMSPRYHEGNL